GHDWGAMTAYGVGAFAPDLFGRIVAMSVPPMPTLQRAFRGRAAIRRGFTQARNSWYVAASQLPVVPELAFAPLVRRLWADWSPGQDAPEALSGLAPALPTRGHRPPPVSFYRTPAPPLRRSGASAPGQRSPAGRPPRPLPLP